MSKTAYTYNNLKVGETYKSYRQLCEVLGAKIEAGDSKKSQLKDWECYFSYRKQGNKFIIDEIYETPKERTYNYKGGNNKTKYIDKIEILILDLLVQSGNDKTLFLSKNKLLKELNMINDKYAYNKYRKNRLSKLMDISLMEIDDFYTTSDDMLQRNLETALNNLRNKAIVMWKTSTTIAYVNPEADINMDFKLRSIKNEIVNEYGDVEVVFEKQNIVNKFIHRKADELDEHRILEAEGIFLDEYKCKSIKDIFIQGLTVDFYKKVKDFLFDHYNIFNYYSSYEITFNKDRAEIEQLELENMLLKDIERKETLNNLNVDVANQINNNTLNRHLNSEKKFEETKKLKYEIRMSNNYVKNGNELVNKFILSEE